MLSMTNCIATYVIILFVIIWGCAVAPPKLYQNNELICYENLRLVALDECFRLAIRAIYGQTAFLWGIASQIKRKSPTNQNQSGQIEIS